MDIDVGLDTDVNIVLDTGVATNKNMDLDMGIIGIGVSRYGYRYEYISIGISRCIRKRLGICISKDTIHINTKKISTHIHTWFKCMFVKAGVQNAPPWPAHQVVKCPSGKLKAPARRKPGSLHLR